MTFRRARPSVHRGDEREPRTPLVREAEAVGTGSPRELERLGSVSIRRLFCPLYPR